MLLPLYLRREPTRDENTRWLAREARKPLTDRHRDVVAYRDPECTRRAAVWPWHYRSKPDRRKRSVMFNCYRWRTVWLPDLAQA